MQVDALAHYRTRDEHLREERRVEGEHEPPPSLLRSLAVRESYIWKNHLAPSSVLGGIKNRDRAVTSLNRAQRIEELVPLGLDERRDVLGESSDLFFERDLGEVRPLECPFDDSVAIIRTEVNVPGKEWCRSHEAERELADLFLLLSTEALVQSNGLHSRAQESGRPTVRTE